MPASGLLQGAAQGLISKSQSAVEERAAAEASAQLATREAQLGVVAAEEARAVAQAAADTASAEVCFAMLI